MDIGHFSDEPFFFYADNKYKCPNTENEPVEFKTSVNLNIIAI